MAGDAACEELDLGMTDERKEAVHAFIELAGARVWDARMAELKRGIGRGQHIGRALQQRHALELALERLRRRGGG